MIPLLTREAVRALDQHAIEKLGVPGLVLMENAGAGATRLLLERVSGQLEKVVILGGVGQNGGDAWVVARHLLQAGIAAQCVLVGPRERIVGDAKVNLEALLRLGVPLELVADDTGMPRLIDALRGATLLVDGLFGTGLDREIRGVFARAVEAINGSDAACFALDLPSGIDANSGQVLGIAVRATTTATFAAHKRGLHQHPGVSHAGEVRCVPIGVPTPRESACALLEPHDLRCALPPRPKDAHKGTNGHVLAVAGSPGKTGAALLCALGALRAGAGLVTVATSSEARRALDQKVLEVMTAELASGAGCAASALALAQGKSSAVLGPGLGLDEAAKQLAVELALALPVPTVLDADALTHLSAQLSSLCEARAPRVLTPHPGEASRLLGCTTAEVQADRYGAAQELALRSAQVVVLKGARTVIAAPDGRLRVCAAGTPALGVAGTGDVLSGIVAALLVEHDAFDAASAAVMLHGLAGEHAAQADRGLLASEVASALPTVLSHVQRGVG